MYGFRIGARITILNIMKIGEEKNILCKKNTLLKNLGYEWELLLIIKLKDKVIVLLPFLLLWYLGILFLDLRYYKNCCRYY